VGGMLLEFKLKREDGHTDWRIVWQFSTLSFALLLIYHLIVFVSGRLPPDISEPLQRCR
jgi:hypothetical protein